MRKYYIVFLLLLAIPLLSGCGNKTNSNPKQSIRNTQFFSQQTEISSVNFSGKKGEKVSFENNKITLDSNIFKSKGARFYNTVLPTGKTVYFFVVKDGSGTYRAAANACQVCSDSRMGFRQEGNYMVCNTCGNKYPLERIATEKGGCNPAPINPDLEVKGGKVTIYQEDIGLVSNFF
ncbi:MAG: DUF2318 domain-containing protein [Elusimicrobia bacterium]|nr:DUF2318 domain-containing protein [Elusimicrobiota bacterium]